MHAPDTDSARRGISPGHSLRGILYAAFAGGLVASLAFSFLACGPGDSVEIPSAQLIATPFGPFNRKVILIGGTSVAKTLEQPAYLRFGPDGNLYVTTYTGSLFAVALNAEHEVVTVTEYKPFGNWMLTGLAFDPDAAPANPVLYVANNHPPLYGAPDHSGRVSRIDNLAANATTDLIVGLPRSAENHMTFDLEFGPDERLYIAQGGNTNNGAPFPGTFGNRSEHPLSAAILAADVKDPAFGGIDDVEVWAPGLRNVYGLCLHSNGFFYATDQGANKGLGGRPNPDGTGLIDVPGSLLDELNVLRPGRYYGHPNPARGEFAFQGDLADGTPHDPPLMNFPDLSVVTGLIEYTAAGNGKMPDGTLLTTGFVDHNIYYVVLSESGLNVLETGVLAGGFSSPLDITVGADGTIYILEAGGTLDFGGKGPAAITVLEPL